MLFFHERRKGPRDIDKLEVQRRLSEVEQRLKLVEQQRRRIIDAETGMMRGER